MAFVNADAREINCKIVYVGASGAGKSENLKAIFHHVSPDVKAGLLEFDTSYQATKYFDFLPISMGQLGDFHLKLHLFTLPVHSAFSQLRPLILRGIDAYVFVADSRMEYLSSGYAELSRFRREMTDQGHDLSIIPGLVQYNKRDLPDAVPIAFLQSCLNEGRLPQQEAVAAKFIGTMETLNLLVKQVFESNAIQAPLNPQEHESQIR